LIPAHEAGSDLWFCFECGSEEHQPPATLVVRTPTE
jgi:hypothetical protein